MGLSEKTMARTIDTPEKHTLVRSTLAKDGVFKAQDAAEHIEDDELRRRVRELLEQSGKPWVIENVPGAPLRDPVVLCGSMFGLDVRRHRLFETSFPLLAPSCAHHLQRGDYPQATNRKNRRRTCEIGVWRIPLEVQQRAIGIDWMDLEGLSQSIPPAYTEYIGHALKACFPGEVKP